MVSNYMFEDIYSEELYDIDGGSTKAAAIGCTIGGAAFAIGACVAADKGHPVVSACCAGASATCFLVGAGFALAPFI